jgi:isopenicillin-N N-acyltransferase-like protein
MKKRNVLRVIECSGSEYEIGRQYGEQARDNLRKALNLLFTTMKLMPYKAERPSVTIAARRYLENVRVFDPGALDRVKGMGDGSGLSFDEVFALQCYNELFLNYPGLAGMCTSFGLTGPATKEGITLLGQNVDWHPDSTIDLLRIRSNDGSRMLGLFLNGYGAYYLTAQGVGNCANMTLCPSAPVSKHIPFPIYLYTAMRRESAKDAMEVIRSASRGIGYLHIADGRGYLSGIESVYDHYAMIEPKEGVLVHANHYETERYKKVDGAYTYIRDSFNRAERLRALISGSYGEITPESMISFLADHEGRPKSVCTHIDPATPPVFAAESVSSFVMIPAEGRMLIAAGQPCETEYVEYRV